MTDPEIIHYSASQLEKLDRCKLKWWWEKIAGYEVPETQSQRLGTEMHAEIEAMILSGTQPQNPRVLEALRHFGEHGVVFGDAGLISERGMSRPLHIPEREMVGRVDLTYLSSDPIKIWDFKSTSDLRRYAKTDYQLASNIQMNIYAHDALESMVPKAREIDVAHLYIQTRGAIRSDLVKVTVDRESVRKRWQGYLKVIDEAEQLRHETDPARVPHNEMACNDYGGCPHRVRCNALIFAKPTSQPQRDTEDWSSLFKKNPAREEGEVLNPPDSTRRLEGAPPATPDTVKFEDLPKVLQKAAKRESADAAAKQEERPVTNPLAALAALGGNKPTSVETRPLGAAGSLAAKLAGLTPPPPPPPPLVEEVKVKRERKKKEPEAAPAQAPTDVAGAEPQVVVADPPPVQADAVPTAPQDDAPRGKLLFLLIDCVPVHGFPAGAIALSKWLEPALEEIKRDTGAPWDFHEFRKGPAILNKYAARLTLPRAMLLCSHSPEASVLLQYLIGQAGCTLQGTR